MADRKPRVWGRWLAFPSPREEYQPEPMTATRRDGTTCDLRRTLGLPSVPAMDEDQGVRWYPYPGEHWS